MHNKLVRVLTEFYTTPWALRRETLAVFQMLLHRAAAGVKLSDAEIQSAIGDAPEAAAQRREQERAAGGDLIAVLPVFGVVGHRAHLVEDVSSGVGTSTELLARSFRAALADPAVAAIVLDVDSPGGSVFGVEELASEIHAARGQKRIIASVNSMAASAAYWIAAAAEEVVITPGGMAGSIGVWSAHEDWSKYMENEGVKVTLISAGKYKVEGNPYEPLSDEARAAEQATVDKYYASFVRSVAKYRGDTVDNVRKGYGEGRVLLAKDAVEARLADRIASFDEVIAGLQRDIRRGQKNSGTTARAHLALAAAEHSHLN